MHLTAGRANPVASRVAAIAAAIKSRSAGASGCVIVMSGDIAFSGKPAEYELATRFFRQLLADLAPACGISAIPLLLIPGNHDCDFSLDTQTRAILLDSIAPGTVDESVIAACVAVQAPYFAFEHTFNASLTDVTVLPASRSL